MENEYGTILFFFLQNVHFCLTCIDLTLSGPDRELIHLKFTEEIRGHDPCLYEKWHGYGIHYSPRVSSR
jgi:hypothetical protein